MFEVFSEIFRDYKVQLPKPEVQTMCTSRAYKWINEEQKTQFTLRFHFINVTDNSCQNQYPQ